ncbi:MAG: protein-glutamate O-methyltransferase CheR [Oscillospiraceae bacterium]
MNIKITDSEFSRLIKFMHKTYGIDLSRKRILIEGRLSNVLAQKGFTNYTDYLNFVFSDKSGKETVTLVNKLTTNHTYFLREPQHFEFMQKVFLPYIEKTVKDHDVRIWCAASSSGEEPYTIAMIIDDYFGSRKAGWDLRILATDISTNVLQKAKNAVYPAESIKNVPQRWREKYFIKNSDGTYTITDRIKREVIFKQFNLMDDIVYKKPFDLIFCRNVMIYFDAPTKDALVERFYDASKKGAYLFIGLAETISKSSRYTFVQPAIYQKK